MLQMIREYLDITADDTSEDLKLKGIIDDGIIYLRSLHPNLTDEEFKKPSRARTLLKNYCRYARSNAVEAFKENFKSDLLDLRMEYEVSACENQNTD